MLWELRVSELRYRAVLEVLDGATVTSVARRFGVSRGTVHVWLGRYAATGGVVNLEDRSSRPLSCPHQMSPALEASVLDDIRVNPATLELEAHETGGVFRTATILSHGTTEQLFLLLRLALAQRLATTGESAPIVLDDVTVQSDAARTLAALELLHELSSDHQIVLFSQEDEVLRWAETELGSTSDRLIRL